MLHNSSSLCSDPVANEGDAGPAYSPHHPRVASESHLSRRGRRQLTTTRSPQYGRHQVREQGQDELADQARHLEEMGGDNDDNGDGDGDEFAPTDNFSPLPADSEYQQISALGPEDAGDNRASAAFKVS